jgi:putative nucleotidyltransferase with HDIG domain
VTASLSPGNFGRHEQDWFGGRDEEAEAAASKSLAATAARIVGAKPFPVAAKRLEELTRTTNARIEQVVVVLESDPALSARLLRLVNSAGYGLKVRCTSVRHAAVLVGTRRLNQVATTAAILDLFESSNTLAAELLEHAAVVGSLCRYLAVHLGLPHDELFTCGFLHDIGKIMLLDTEREVYPSMLREFGGSADAIHEQERRVFGFDHATLGAHVLTTWNIPEPVPKVIAWHHQPARALQDSLLSAMVQTLRLADVLAYELGRNGDEAGIALVAATEAAQYLDISEPQLAAMWQDLLSLRDRSRARSHGETDLEVADPRLEVPNSLRPRGSLSPRSLKSGIAPTQGSIAARDFEGDAVERQANRSSKDLPNRLSCVVCGTGSYGNICQACGGHVCPQHQEGADEWCSLCGDEFVEFKTRYRVPPSVLTAVASVVLLSLIGSFFSAWSSGNTGASAFLAPLLLAVVWGLVLPIASKSWIKLRFMRGLSPRTPPRPSVVTSGQTLRQEGEELLSSEPQDGLVLPSLHPDYDRSTLRTSVAAPIEPFAAGLAGLAGLPIRTQAAEPAPSAVSAERATSQAESERPAGSTASEPNADARAASEPPPSSRGPMVIRVDVPSISPQALNARLEASLSSADSQLSALERLAIRELPSEAPEISVGVLSLPHLRSQTPTLTPSLLAAASEGASETSSEPASETPSEAASETRMVASEPPRVPLATPVVAAEPPVVAEAPAVSRDPQVVVAQPQVIAVQPQVIAAQAQVVAAQAQAVAAQPQAVAAQAQAVAAQAQAVAAQPQAVAAQPQAVAAQPQAVAAQPQVIVTQPQVIGGAAEPHASLAEASSPAELHAPQASEPTDAVAPDERSGVRHVLLRNEPGVLRAVCVPVVAENRCS